MSVLHHCEISDSFVHPNLKLANGKNGNGESRLFISNNYDYAKQLVNKKWILEYSTSYKNDIKLDFETELFRKPKKSRYEYICQKIDKLNGKEINIQLQQGNMDINRNYIGCNPHRRKQNKTDIEKNNIQLWDDFRQSLMPTKTTLQFFDNNEYIKVYVSHNKNIHRYKKIHGCSFISLEFMRIFSIANNIEIQTAKTKEFQLRNPSNGYMWPVDGYHNCELHNCKGTKNEPCIWNKTVFEFQGDYWHKNKKEKDCAKKEFYIQSGYNWFEITESEWNNRKKTMKMIKPT